MSTRPNDPKADLVVDRVSPMPISDLDIAAQRIYARVSYESKCA
jgi:hypothetical protein